MNQLFLVCTNLIIALLQEIQFIQQLLQFQFKRNLLQVTIVRNLKSQNSLCLFRQTESEAGRRPQQIHKLLI